MRQVVDRTVVEVCESRSLAAYSASVDDHSAALAAEASSSLQPASSELVATTPPIATLAPMKVRRFSPNFIGLCRRARRD